MTSGVATVVPRDLTGFADHLRTRLTPLADELVSAPTESVDSDRIAAVEELRAGHDATVANMRRLQRALFDAGIASPSGPRDLGGLGLTSAHDTVLDTVLDELDFPSREALFVGLNIVAPALVHHAPAELRERVVTGLYRGDLIGCQLFSEPGAGSDLAGVRTRAMRDRPSWVQPGHAVASAHCVPGE